VIVPTLGAGAALTLGALGYRTFWSEPRSLEVNHHTLALPHWPAEASGLRVGVISDVHSGAPHVPLARVPKLVERMNAESPDLVALLGDYASPLVLGGRRLDPGPVADALGQLIAPRGVFGVLGNHDWRVHGRAMGRAMEAAGITMLENSAVPVGPLWVAGLPDLRMREPSIERTFGGIPDGVAVLALSHDPDMFPHVPDRVALTLSGHTHGNQINVPVARRMLAHSHFGVRYAGGHVVEEGRHLFVSRGVGTSLLPGRFRAAPELLVLELVSG